MSVRLYSLDDPSDYSFAFASCLGTWYPNPGRGLCPECTASSQQLVAPLIVEWEPGSDLIGDFTWAGEAIVTKGVREALEARFRGFEFLLIEMYQNPRLKRPERVTKRTQPRLWLPHEGPTLWGLRAPAECSLNLERSRVSLERVCRTCGKTFYNFPYRRDRRVVVDPSTWAWEHAFHLRELPGVIVVTEEVKRFIESRAFSNVRCWAMGEVPD